MKVVGFYHAYLTNDTANWSHVIMDQFFALERSRLLKSFNELHITAIGSSENLDRFAKLFTNYGFTGTYRGVISPWESDEEMVRNLDSPRNVTESITHKKIWSAAAEEKESTAYLYFHTKGITSHNRHFNTNMSTYVAYDLWRKYMDYWYTEKWWSMVRALDSGKDLVGVNYMETPAPHFSGGYWWARSDYIRKLPDPESSQWWNDLQERTSNPWLKTCPKRFSSEFWVGSIPHSVECYHSNPEGTNLSAQLMHPDSYIHS